MAVVSLLTLYMARHKGRPVSRVKKTNTSKMFMVIFAAAVIVIIGLAVSSKGKTPSGLSIGSPVPEVVLKDFGGKEVAIPAGSKGKVVLMHFWLSGCSYCVKEMCTLESLYRKYGSGEIIAFSINAGDGRKAAASYIENLHITYPVLLDTDRSTVRQYGITGVPTTYILDRDGLLRHRIIGEITADRMDAIIKDLM